MYKLDPRLQGPLDAVQRAEQAVKEAWKAFNAMEDVVLQEHELDPDECDIPRTHECDRSPVGYCVYYMGEEWCHFCDEPEERK